MEIVEMVYVNILLVFSVGTLCSAIADVLKKERQEGLLKSVNSAVDLHLEKQDELSLEAVDRSIISLDTLDLGGRECD